MSTQSIEKVQQIKNLAQLIESRKESFAAVAGKHYDADRLVKLGQAALSRNQGLAAVDPASLLVALMRCAELGLEPDAALPQRRMWIVPRWNSRSGKTEVQSTIDYRAQIQLSRDSGLVKSIVAAEVKEGDAFHVVYDADGSSITKFTYEPDVFGKRGPTRGFFAAARLEGGEVQIVTMSVAEAEKHRDDYGPRNKKGELTGPWTKEFGPMAIKTCLRKLFNLLPAGQSESARKLQEEVAKEAAEVEVDVVPAAPAELPAGTRTEQVKARLAAAQGKTPAAAPAPAAEEPHVEPAAEEREPGSDDGAPEPQPPEDVPGW